MTSLPVPYTCSVRSVIYPATNDLGTIVEGPTVPRLIVRLHIIDTLISDFNYDMVMADLYNVDDVGVISEEMLRPPTEVLAILREVASAYVLSN